jgi:hypothetical protein
MAVMAVAEPPAPVCAKQVKAMTVVQLRAALAARGLETSGLKPALTARMLAMVTDAPPETAPMATAEPSATPGHEQPTTRDPASERAVRSSARATGTRRGC